MNTQTPYMGLRLDSPIVVSACTLSEETDNVLAMEDNGAGAVVLFSLFEEQIRAKEARFKIVQAETTNSSAESLDFFPDLDEYNVGADDYLEHIARLKNRVKIPIIASLNGITNEGWINYSKMMEEAGADAI